MESRYDVKVNSLRDVVRFLTKMGYNTVGVDVRKQYYISFKPLVLIALAKIPKYKDCYMDFEEYDNSAYIGVWYREYPESGITHIASHQVFK